MIESSVNDREEFERQQQQKNQQHQEDLSRSRFEAFWWTQGSGAQVLVTGVKANEHAERHSELYIGVGTGRTITMRYVVDPQGEGRWIESIDLELLGMLTISEINALQQE